MFCLPKRLEAGPPDGRELLTYASAKVPEAANQDEPDSCGMAVPPGCTPICNHKHVCHHQHAPPVLFLNSKLSGRSSRLLG